MGRADWMAGRWGIMVHWIAPGPPPEQGPYRTDLNDAVNHFNVPRFLEDFAATGADWLIFTVGQNTGYYISPNSLLDKWAGPGHCSERDLIQEIIDGVTGTYVPQEPTVRMEDFVSAHLKSLGINRILLQPGMRVGTLRQLRDNRISTAFDLKQQGLPLDLFDDQASLTQQWLSAREEEAQTQSEIVQKKRFIAYLPCEVAANQTVHQAFHWNTVEGTDQATFQDRYLDFVGEWAKRWGQRCSGWWFDGCYTWPIFHNKYMQWSDWTSTCRQPNPFAALAFNDGSFCIGNTKPVAYEQDFLSGEVEILQDSRIRLGRSTPPTYHLPESRYVPGTHCQWHALLPIDCAWAHGAQPTGVFAERFAPVPENPIFPIEKPVYTDDELLRFLDSTLSASGAVTFNVGIYQEGHLGPETVAQLKRVGQRLQSRNA